MKSSTCCDRTGTSRRRDRGRRLAAAGLAVVLSTVGVSADEADRAFRRHAADAGEPDPLIRVGFDDGDQVRLAADRGRLRILDPLTGRDVWRSAFDGEIVVLPAGAPEGGTGTVFRVQVGAFSDRAAAEAERDRLAGDLGVPAVVRYVPDRGSWRVRVGESTDRDGLAALIDRLRADGHAGLWIAEEPAEALTGVTLRLVDGRTFESRVIDATRLAVVATGNARLTIDGVRYRGVVEVRATAFGTVRAINWVGLEHYLLGVVPAELGPEVWPRIEALKAQAVAARTYAWGHMGQFSDDGFDQCATPRCQVYKGLDAEHPLSDRAVAATSGEILTWEGTPINAMFTATCGGHTEDAGEIFPEERAPYLRGVPCRAEGDALRTRRFVLAGREVAPILDVESGRDVTRDWASLVALGILDPDPDAIRAPVVAHDLDRWTRALRGRAGLPAVPVRESEIRGLGDVAARLVAALGWEERARILLAEEDIAAVVRDPEVLRLPADQRRAIAWLARTGALAPGPDGAFGVAGRPVGTRLVPALAEAARTYEAVGFRRGTVAESTDAGLRLYRGKGETTRPLHPNPFLFGAAGDRAVARSRLELWPGDRVRYRVDDRGRIDYLELLPPLEGVSDDRTSSRYSWEIRKTRRELERGIRARVDVGTLTDLRVVRRGVSGRVVELEVVGTRGRDVVRGFDIRRLLGLRESLVVFDVQRDESGGIEAVVFAGKGWGHGIGLCQVGAYGMALRGRNYREILAHYYRGTRLERSSPTR